MVKHQQAMLAEASSNDSEPVDFGAAEAENAEPHAAD
jgi:hypothetical protein